jgi:hypothetical protein
MKVNGQLHAPAAVLFFSKLRGILFDKMRSLCVCYGMLLCMGPWNLTCFHHQKGLEGNCIASVEVIHNTGLELRIYLDR